MSKNQTDEDLIEHAIAAAYRRVKRNGGHWQQPASGRCEVRRARGVVTIMLGDVGTYRLSPTGRLVLVRSAGGAS